MQKFNNIVWQTSGILLLCLTTANLVQAQIHPDGTTTTGVNSSDGSNFTITDGNQSKDGKNLFHSFKEFSVPKGGEAYFKNNINIQNIFSRVTGGSQSLIDGLIKANGSANLFLINPNGIIFGPNAQLNIGGSFIGSTADGIKFADGSFFSATESQKPPILTVSIPIGLQFRDNSGKIVNQSRVGNPMFPAFPDGLQVIGKTLALVGGDIILEGGALSAPSGRIELASVGSNSFVSLNPVAESWSLGFERVRNFQNITLFSSLIQTSSASENNIIKPSGNILFTGKEIVIDRSQVSSSHRGVDKGGSIFITASESLLVNNSFIGANSRTTGISGDIVIKTQQLSVQQSFLGTYDQSTPGQEQGQGGDIKIDASDSVEINGNGTLSQLTTATFGSGKAGNIEVTTKRLILRDGGQIDSSTQSSGLGGNININASEFAEATGTGIINTSTGIQVIPSGVFARSRVETARDAGDINITTPKLTLRDQATISASTISSQGGNIELNLKTLAINKDSEISASTESGQAGNLNINATDSINLNRDSRLTVEATRYGTSGNLFLSTPLLTLLNSAKISAESFSGQGGNIHLNLQNLNVTRQSDITASTIIGIAGDLNINATDSVNVSGGSRLSVEAKSDGAAGSLTLTANSLSLNQGTITAQTQQPGNEGANIRLQVADSIKLRNESDITATSTGTANGGNITINTPFLTAYPPEGFNGNDITANSQGGVGGKIDITAKGVSGIQVRDNLTIDNDITAFSQLNPNLNVVINFDPNRGLVQFSTVVINPTTLINQDPCIAQDESQLVISRRGGLPPSIIEPISDRAIAIELVKPVNSTEQSQNQTKQPKSSTQTPIIPARGWVYNGKGEVILTAYDPTAKAPQREQNKENVCPIQ